MESVLLDFVRRHDPVEKAQRVEKKKPGQNLLTRVNQNSGRPKRLAKEIRLNANQRHSVYLKSQGQCCYVDSSGVRCTEKQWLHVHHKLAVALGGTNEPDNLEHLCAAHHDLVHQISFPGVMAPFVAYQCS